jgi:hypothetical protein
MTQPGGLGVDSTHLFVCDDVLKVYSIAQPASPVFLKSYPIQAYDVIPPTNGLLIAVASQGLYQYRYTADTVYQISVMPFGRVF